MIRGRSRRDGSSKRRAAKCPASRSPSCRGELATNDVSDRDPTPARVSVNRNLERRRRNSRSTVLSGNDRTSLIAGFQRSRSCHRELAETMRAWAAAVGPRDVVVVVKASGTLRRVMKCLSRLSAVNGHASSLSTPVEYCAGIAGSKLRGQRVLCEAASLARSLRR